MSFKPSNSTWLTLCLLLSLSGCSLTTIDKTEHWLSPEQRKANQQIQHWQISGKIGLRGETSANTAYLNWQQCDEQFEIRLTGPLGQGSAILFGNKDQVILQTKEGRRTATSPEQLLAQMGWQIPVSQLYHWVRGLPSPQFETRQESSEGFSQTDWQLRYTQWQNIHSHRLPKKAIATHPELKVTLLLKNWALEPTCRFSALPSDSSES